METPFSITARQLAAYAHVVPDRYRNAATELAALVLLAGRPIDPDLLYELIDAVPRDVRSIADMVVGGLQKQRDKQRREICNWAQVLLTFRSGKTDEWETELDKRVERNVKRRR